MGRGGVVLEGLFEPGRFELRVALIFPTGTDPRSPHLALPCLAAVLRKAGIDTELIDLDIDALLSILQPDFITEAGARLRKSGQASAIENAGLRRLLGLSELLPERVKDALSTFHDSERFYDPIKFQTARDTIFDCLDLVSAASTAQVRYNIFPISYDVEGIDIHSLKDLVTVTADQRANLFADFWETSVFPNLQKQSPDLIGITITNRQQIIPGLMLARQLRQRGYFVILGGTVYTKFVTQLAKLPTFFEYFADGVVVYEGETALLELLTQLQAQRDFSKVPNYLYLENGRVRVTPNHVEDVSLLPTPDFAGLPLHRYLTPEPVLPLIFGKGCYFNRCKFCDIPYINHISKKAYRLRPLELIAADILELNRRFDCRHFEFTDEALSAKLLEGLAEELSPYRDQRFCFVGYARLEPSFTLRCCQKLAQMGMKKLFFGLESGAQETLDHMDKGIRVTDVPAVLKNCSEAGINFHIFSIVGFPEESEQSARQTCRFFQENNSIIDNPGNSFDIHPFGLELRTRYFEEAENMGVLIAAEELAKEFVIGVGDSWTNTRGVTKAQVESLLEEFHCLMRQIYCRYHATPQPLWPPFEEFSVLYSDWYDRRKFPYRSSLPVNSGVERYRLRWSRAALIDVSDGNQLRIISRHGQAELDQETYDLLASKKYRTTKEMLDRLCPNSDPITRFLTTQTVNELIEKCLLQIDPYLEFNQET